MTLASDSHQDFLDRYYRHIRHIYDFTRKYYLFGRDTLLQQLLQSPWNNLLEIGVGTGRNLKYLYSSRPHAQYCGLDLSSEMLKTSTKQCPWAVLHLGNAEEESSYSQFKTSFDCIVFSYSLSMIPNPDLALKAAHKALSKNGKIWIVDFADMNSTPEWSKKKLKQFLNQFHVSQLKEDWIRNYTNKVQFGHFRYFLIAEISKNEVNSRFI